MVLKSKKSTLKSYFTGKISFLTIWPIQTWKGSYEVVEFYIALTMWIQKLLLFILESVKTESAHLDQSTTRSETGGGGSHNYAQTSFRITASKKTPSD